MKIKKSKLLNLLGVLLIVLALVLLTATTLPIFYYETKYQVSKFTYPKADISSDIGTEENLDFINGEFSILIPKIRVSAPIIKNVNPADEKEFLKVLKSGVAHAKGTSFPGEDGNIYIFAHSTNAFFNVGKYNAVFYLIGKLVKEDEILIKYNSDIYKYRVIEKKVVYPDESSYLYMNDSDQTLTLQTCYPPGTTLKRLVVVSKRIE